MIADHRPVDARAKHFHQIVGQHEWIIAVGVIQADGGMKPGGHDRPPDRRPKNHVAIIEQRVGPQRRPDRGGTIRPSTPANKNGRLVLRSWCVSPDFTSLAMFSSRLRSDDPREDSSPARDFVNDDLPPELFRNGRFAADLRAEAWRYAGHCSPAAEECPRARWSSPQGMMTAPC